MLRFKTPEKAQTYTKSMQQEIETLPKETVHAKQSQVTRSQTYFPNKHQALSKT